MRLSLATLDRAQPSVRLPAYDVASLRPGIVHLGLGAFHRAHQAVFTEDAIETSGGAWGIVGVSMRRPDVAQSLAPQDGLYTVETLGARHQYRVVGAVRAALTLPLQPQAVIAALADPQTHIISLTITEKGYCLAGEELDLDHPDIVRDLVGDSAPRSAIGVLAKGLAERLRQGGAPVTIISCDNLAHNGPRLEKAVRSFAERTNRGLLGWLEAGAAFPETMVDCIVPASNADSLARVREAVGLSDEGAVQREPFAQWVIEDRFAARRPTWGDGVQFVGGVEDHRRLKLHVLNAAHSALAHLGLPRNHVFVRQAIHDASLAAQLDAMILEEVAPALPELPVRDYWRTTRGRFANPAIDHRLEQIAQDAPAKLAERFYPLMLANHRAGRPIERMASVVRAWLQTVAPDGRGAALQDTRLFPPAFRAEPELAAAVLGGQA